jgi:hypothetical protein
MTKSLTAQAERQVGAPDLLWLAWRQHRWAIVSGAVLVATLCGFMLSNEAGVVPVIHQSCGGGADCLSYLFASGFFERSTAADLQLWLATGLGGIVAVFWAAPLVAREFEQRTHLLAWSQDVSARRWLVGQVVVLAVVATAFAAVLGVVAGSMVDRLAAADPQDYSAFDGMHFEASVPLQIAYVLFGFALGLAASVVLRRTVPAMGATLAVFAGVRAAVSLLRHNYLPPAHVVTALSASIGSDRIDGLVLSVQTVDAAGRPVNDLATNCLANANTEAAQDACLRRNGIVGYLAQYQPADRLPTFRLIETGIFVVLAVALFAVTWLWLRRSTVRGAR